MRLCIIDREFTDTVASLSQSNQMDTEERSWASLCNLLAELADDSIDEAEHKRHLKRAGFKADAELCARMSSTIIERARKLGALAGRLTLTAMLLAGNDNGGEGDE